MANNSAHVVVGKPNVAGGAYRAPLGTALPTDTKTALGETIKALGYVTDAGVVESTSISTSNIVAWGGDTVRTVQTESTLTYALTLLEAVTDEAAKAYYGDGNVTTAAGPPSTVSIKVKGAQAPREIWVFEIKDGERAGRIVLPNCQVTDKGDVSYVDGDAITYPVTLTAYPDEDGVKAFIYWDDGTSA